MANMNSEQSSVESNQSVHATYEHAVEITDISQTNMLTQTSSVANTRKRLAVLTLSDPSQSDFTAIMPVLLDRSTAEMKTVMAEKLDLKMEDLRLDMDKLAVGNVELRARNQINEGRITLPEKVVSDLHEDILQDKRRSMRDHLIFSHIPESP